MGSKDSASDQRTPQQLKMLYQSLLAEYLIILLEDPFAENDWASWVDFNKDCEVELVGDNLLVTNTRYIQEAHDKKACNGMLLKVNQISTITESTTA